MKQGFVGRSSHLILHRKVPREGVEPLVQIEQNGLLRRRLDLESQVRLEAVLGVHSGDDDAGLKEVVIDRQFNEEGGEVGEGRAVEGGAEGN